MPFLPILSSIRYLIVCTDLSVRRAAQKPVLYKMFGNAPKKGDRVTAADMFARTFKGFQEMRQLIKKWGLKGIEVEYISADKEFVLNTDVEPWSGADTDAE